VKRLVLLGGGHAHVHVLDSLAEHPLADTEVTLISPYPRQIYSGMLPGWIAGHYTLDQCAIDLTRLAERARCRFLTTRAIGLDLNGCTVLCEDGSLESFDWLSIDVGPVTAGNAIDGAEVHALQVRPIETFIGGINQMLPLLKDAVGDPVAIVGAGAAGLELAFALRHRSPATPITLIGSDPLPLDGLPPLLRRHALKTLTRKGIDWIGEHRAQHVDSDGLILDDGTIVRAGHVLQVTGAAAQPWPATAGLAVDERGFIQVNPCLQSRSHPHVFAAGDIAAYHDPRPKSGVFAVRAGAPLTRNLRKAVNGEPLEAWTPQHRALYLISTGDHHALGAWGPFAWWGDWVWRWKDRIDRQFMARFGA